MEKGNMYKWILGTHIFSLKKITILHLPKLKISKGYSFFTTIVSCFQFEANPPHKNLRKCKNLHWSSFKFDAYTQTLTVKAKPRTDQASNLPKEMNNLPGTEATPLIRCDEKPHLGTSQITMWLLINRGRPVALLLLLLQNKVSSRIYY